MEVVLVERRQGVRSPALGLLCEPSGATGTWTGARAGLSADWQVVPHGGGVTSPSGCCHWLALQILKASSSLYSVLAPIRWETL